MAGERLTPAERARVVGFANAHGPRAAARKFGVKLATVKTWQHRARHRPARPAPRPAAPAPTHDGRTPAERFEAEAKRLAERYLQGACLGCGGDGVVVVPAVTRGSLTIRKARRVPCPTCGGRVRHIEVVELPRREWFEGLRVASDLGLGWSGAEWSRIQNGEPDPDGQRFTGRGEGRPPREAGLSTGRGGGPSGAGAAVLGRLSLKRRSRSSSRAPQ
jgi:hypothetical protein